MKIANTHGKTSTLQKRMFRYGGIVVSLIMLLAGLFTYFKVQRNLSELELELQHQETIQVANKMESFSMLLNSFIEQGGKLINSDLFRLFSAEVGKLGDDIQMLITYGTLDDILSENREKQSNPLLEQLPLMQNLLREFILYSDFLHGSIVNEKKQVYLSSEKTPLPISTEQSSFIQEVFVKKTVLFSPIRNSPNGPTIDIFFPITSPYSEQKNDKPVAVLIVSKIITGDLLKYLSTPIASSLTSAIYLIQKTASLEYITMHGIVEKLTNSPFTSSALSTIPFALRKSVMNSTLVYSLGMPIPKTNWILIEEIEKDIAQKEVHARTTNLIIVTMLSTLASVLLFIALWWYFMEKEQRALARDFKSLYLVIDEQKELLSGINSSLTEMISLSDTEGILQYVNSSFAKKLGKHSEEILGKNLEEIFGFDTAKRITTFDRTIYSSGTIFTFEEIIFIHSKKYHFQITRTPYRIHETISGIVSVYRDITDIVNARERNEILVQQTTEALIRTIEMRDPYLAGHTRIVSECVQAIAPFLSCSEDSIKALHTASKLSQIGKLCIPSEILTKKSSLTEEEKKIMEQHVAHALSIISVIDFELPIATIIGQANERIDGTGYPNQLTENEICIEAKILAVINTFCALVKPRSYRPALEIHSALEEIKKQHIYSEDIINSLEQFLESEEGHIFTNKFI
ncbi:MAG: HD domain-containing phosphohydrolase [Desulfovibrionaceae bacterium]